MARRLRRVTRSRRLTRPTRRRSRSTRRRRISRRRSSITFLHLRPCRLPKRCWATWQGRPAGCPTVKVFSIGTTEEGREMIAVAISSPENLKKLEENRARLAKLADPRTIKLDDEEADRIVAQAVPVYYITGTIHSPETGAPTALMELAYRLAVDESPYIREIREGTITLITPVVEVDGATAW